VTGAGMEPRAFGEVIREIRKRLVALERRQIGRGGHGGVSLAGAITLFAGSAAPQGFFLCNGAVYDPAANPNLFTAIGVTYGGTPVAPLLPDLRGRVVVGQSAADTEFNAVGKHGGEKTHTLIFAEVPEENGSRITWGRGTISFNTQPQAQASAPTGNGLGTFQNDPAYDADSRPVGGGAHNNLQPFLVMNYIIQGG
jgi:microcystin-dependent protein